MCCFECLKGTLVFIMRVMQLMAAKVYDFDADIIIFLILNLALCNVF